MAAPASAVHALSKTCFLNSLAIQPAGVLTAVVKVENGTPKARTCLYCVLYFLAHSGAFILVSIARPRTALSIAVKSS